MTRVLMVDDEPSVLRALSLVVGRRFEVSPAASGAEALEILQSEGPFAAVISDMRMPAMDGAEFLARAREVAPDTVRLLLSGQADLESMIAVVNKGQVFRFLTKPCAADQLLAALDDAVEQHRLVAGQRELLEQTLVGSLQMLNDVLALSDHEAFGRATHVKEEVGALAEQFAVRDRWQLETAAMLSQVGYVTLDDATLARVNGRHPLSLDDELLLMRLPAIAEQLIAHIPRLDGVRAILRGVVVTPPAGESTAGAGNNVARSVALLRIVLDFHRLDARGTPRDEAIASMRSLVGYYNREALDAFARLRAPVASHGGVLEISFAEIEVGMTLADDLRTTDGVLLAAKGYAVTAAFVARARNIRSQTVVEPVKCLPSRANAGLAMVSA